MAERLFTLNQKIDDLILQECLPRFLASAIKWDIERLGIYVSNVEWMRTTSKHVEAWIERVTLMALHAEHWVDLFNYRLSCQKENNFFHRVLRMLVVDADLIQTDLAENLLEQISQQLFQLQKETVVCVRSRHTIHTRIEYQYGQTQTANKFEYRIERNHKLRNQIYGKNIKLESCLMKESNSSFIALAVTGSAGMGKTSLAKRVYMDVKQKFQCYAWVVAAENSTLGILQGALKGFFKSQLMMLPNNVDELDEPLMKDVIRNHLRGKDFLLAIDGISPSQWDGIHDTFSVNCQGKVLLTSRSSSEFKEMKVDEFEVEKPSKEAAEKILQMHIRFGCTKTKQNKSLDDFKSPVPMESFANSFAPTSVPYVTEILNQCVENPLAIATIGGILPRYNMEGVDLPPLSHLQGKFPHVELCYATLTKVLKSCFIFGALFPSFLYISCKKIERMWIALGLINEAVTDGSKEDTARRQMYELIQRNMFKLEKLGNDGKPKYISLLQPIKEFALKSSRHYQACSISGYLSAKRPLRLCLNNITSTSAKNMKIDFKGLQTFIVFDKANTLGLFAKSNWLSEFKLLSVLDMQDVPITTLPASIGDLYLLQYMGLRGTKVATLPLSIKNLQKLQTLDVRDTLLESLPSGLESSKRIRHLHLANSYGKKAIALLANVEFFQQLQTLAGVLSTQNIVKGLESLPQLKKLSIAMVTNEQSHQLTRSIDKMPFLQSLTIKCQPGDQITIPLINPLASLEKLRVGGQVMNLTNWARRLKSLKLLYVWDCSMSSDTFKALQDLPNLVLLSVCNVYVGENIQFQFGGFPALRRLSILHCTELSEWKEITNGAMPYLKKLTIAYCPKLNTLPKGLDKLSYLRMFQVTDMNQLFVQQARDFVNQVVPKFSLIVQPKDNSQKTTPNYPVEKNSKLVSLLCKEL